MKLDKDWAHKLKEREEAGEKLNRISSLAWREVLHQQQKKEKEKKKTIKVYAKM
jgi:hypothetical protein